jgi:hypothetical protein
MAVSDALRSVEGFLTADQAQEWISEIEKRSG